MPMWNFLETDPSRAGLWLSKSQKYRNQVTFPNRVLSVFHRQTGLRKGTSRMDR